MRSKHTDLLIGISLTTTTIYTITQDTNLVLDPIYLIAGLFTILVWPGYLLYYLIINQQDKNIGEVVLYSLGLSTCISLFVIPIISLLNFITFGKIKLTPILAVVIIAVITICLRALHGRSLPEQESFGITYDKIVTSCVYSAPLVSFLLASILNTGSETSKIPVYGLILYSLFLTIVVQYSSEEFNIPIIVLAIGITLALHNSLVSQYILGRDLHTEYYLAETVIRKGFWDITIADPYNSLLSVVSFAPLIETLTPLNLSYTFKLVYPLVYSFTTLSIYYISLKILEKKAALLSTCLFIFISPYYMINISTARQQISMLFLSLIIMHMVRDKPMQSSVISILCVSIIVSHYATAILGGIFIIGGVILYHIVSYIKGEDHHHTIPLRVLALLGVFSIFWFSNTSSGIFFTDMVFRLYTISTNLLNPGTSSSLGAVSGSSSNVIETVNKAILMLILLIIGIGVLAKTIQYLLLEDSKNDTFIATSVSACAFLAITTVTPYFGLEVTRLASITLIILAPFSQVGFNRISKTLSLDRVADAKSLFSIFLVIVLILNSGMASDMTGMNPSSPSMSGDTIHNQNLDEKFEFYNYYTSPVANVYTSKWIRDHADLRSHRIYLSGLSYSTLISYGRVRDASTWFGETSVSSPLYLSIGDFQYGSYIYISYVNKRENLISVRGFDKKTRLYEFDEVRPGLVSTNTVYTNGNSSVRKVRK